MENLTDIRKKHIMFLLRKMKNRKSNSDASLIKRLQAGLSSFFSLSYIAIVICFYLKEYAAD